MIPVYYRIQIQYVGDYELYQAQMRIGNTGKWTKLTGSPSRNRDHAMGAVRTSASRTEKTNNLHPVILGDVVSKL